MKDTEIIQRSLKRINSNYKVKLTHSKKKKNEKNISNKMLCSKKKSNRKIQINLNSNTGASNKSQCYEIEKVLSF